MNFKLLLIIYSFIIISLTSAQQIKTELESSYERCAQSERICFGFPDQCAINKNCEILLTALPLNDANKSVEFQIIGTPNNPNNSYLAMSLGQTSLMGGSVTICALGNHSNVFLRNGLNTGNGGHGYQALGYIEGIELSDAEFSDGLLRCKWNRNSVTNVNGVEYNIANTSYHLHVAKGLWNETRDYISRHTNRIASEIEYDLQTLPQNSSSTTTTTTTERPQQLDGLYTKCNAQELLCFGLPNNCVEQRNCRILGSSIASLDQSVTFQLNAQINTNSYYIAYGLSQEKDLMGGSVAQCYLDASGQPKFGLSLNSYDRHANSLVANVSGIDLISSTYENGVISCVWHRQPFTVVETETVNLVNNSFYLQLARGVMNGDSLTRHEDRIYSPEAINLQSIGIISGSRVSIYIKWHGALMIVAWVGCVSTGIIMARYFRDDWQHKTIFGVKIWFMLHRSIMMVSWSAMIASIVLIWYYRGKWSGPYAHPVCGLLSVLFATLQILGAFFRPHPHTQYRWIFDWAHWAQGNLAHLLAFITIILAYWAWHDLYLPNSFFWVFISFIVFYLLLQDAFKKLTAKAAEKKSSEYSSTSSSLSIQEKQLDSAYERIFQSKIVALTVYLIGTSAVVITLVVLIATF